jgi:predicted hydrolase (HD superfamily)
MTTKQKRSAYNRRMDRIASRIVAALEGVDPMEGIVVMAALICGCTILTTSTIEERTRLFNKIITLMKERILDDLG